MKIAFICFTRVGFELMHAIAVRFAVESDRVGDDISLTTTRRLAEEMGLDSYDDLGTWTGARFADSDAIVFVGATGIAVRAIAPHVNDKFADPAVVCLDERGRVVVPLLSGHAGGANELARELAGYTGGIAAVSTATDVEGVFAVDEWARKHGLAIVERDTAKEVSAALLEGEPVGYVNELRNAPQGQAPQGADIGVCVGIDREARPFERTLHLVPQVVTLGVGCRRGVAPAALEARVREVLAQHRIAPQAVKRIASIDVKRDEPAILQLARAFECEARFYSAEELNRVEGDFEASAFVRETVGVDNVCERAAVAGGGRLVVGKQAGAGMTVALAVDDCEIEPPAGLANTVDKAVGEGAAGDAAGRGKLSVVGLGPGAEDDMTRRAYRVLKDCDTIIGYTVYIDLLKREFPDKPMLATSMRHEVERCELALARAAAGEHVALVCSGDPGVYGMAGLCHELSDKFPDVEIEIVPGVTAASGGASVLGAPLMHDFAVISLSDLMTPWETIERRLEAAAASDLVICLYNPSSKKRADYLRRACDILLRHKAPETVCGTVRNIGRDGEAGRVTTLAELRDAQVDMFTTVFVGNAATKVVDGHMVTPRGYLQRGSAKRAAGGAEAPGEHAPEERAR